MISNNNISKVGILDPEGLNMNPLNNKPYSSRYKELAKKWSNFPVYKNIIPIMEDIKNNQVLLILSSTGSGKSVIMPKIALHILNYNGKVMMTLPKQIITKATAEFGAITLDVDIGDEVGYVYRGSDNDSYSQNTKLLYATHGTLVAMLLNDPALKEYDCILLDEVHERSIQIDLLIYLLRETLRLRTEFKLILMSATVDSHLFENYFKDFKFKKIDVPGQRLYPIESHYLNRQLTYNEIIDEGFKKLVTILENTSNKKSDVFSNDIIFFVTSANEAFEMCRRLSSYINKTEKDKCNITCEGDIFCVSLYSGIDKTLENLAQDKDAYKLNTNYYRKVVISTNVAESSLTIDGIKYVIDTGYELKSSYDADMRGRRLDRKLISKAQVKQRIGRSGRVDPGIAYHLYTLNDYNSMQEFPLPDIRTNDITEECLKLLDIESIGTVDLLVQTLMNFIEPPTKKYLKVAINNLIQMGMIENNSITKLGNLVNLMPVNNLFMAVTIIYGKLYNVSYEIMKIISIIELLKGNLNEIYRLPSTIIKQGNDTQEQYIKKLQNLEDKFNVSRTKFASKYGDHISLLNIFDKFKIQYDKHKDNISKLQDWCYKHFLKLDILLKALKNYKKMKNIVNNLLKKDVLNTDELNITISREIQTLDQYNRILSCFVIGFRLNTAYLDTNKNVYRTQFSKTSDNIKINKISFLNLKKKLPSNALYYELFSSMGKNEINIVSEIPKKVISVLK